MNKDKKQLVDLLNSVINNESPKLQYDKNTNWQEIREISEKHRVDGLVYTAIKNSLADTIEPGFFREWEKDTFQKSLTMHNLVIIITKSLKLLQDNDIELILLKGLAVRSFYPYPDLRTMSDADILVHKKDLEKIDSLLKQSGYDEYGRTEHHITYVSKCRATIEVHWSLDKHFIKGKEYILSDNIWDKLVDVQLCGINFKSLSYEDLITHLSFHMACHMADSGFGIRQLIDLVLVVNGKGKEIDWQIYFQNIKKSGIDKFSIAIFNVANFLFSMKVPKEIKGEYKINTEQTKIIADEILRFGVYGNKEEGNINNKLAYNTAGGSKSVTIKRVMSIIFPNMDKLSELYPYVNNSKLLLPIAYISRIISLINKFIIYSRNNGYRYMLKQAKEKKEVYNILDL